MKKKKDSTDTSAKDSLAKAIADTIIGMQLCICNALKQWERRCSAAQKKVVFFLFFGIATGYCSHILCSALLGAEKTKSIPKEYPGPVKIPQLWDSVNTSLHKPGMIKEK